MSGIDPKLLKFGLALVIAGVVIGLLDKASRTAAWVLVFILLLGLFLNNPLLIGYLNLGTQSLSQSIR